MFDLPEVVANERYTDIISRAVADTWFSECLDDCERGLPYRLLLDPYEIALDRFFNSPHASAIVWSRIVWGENV